jgi:NAD(P)-dependent dehydrogenase (short-subunit alcohol dehydrogenase family)
VAYLACDVADRQSLESALDRVREQFGPITALVHGAGVLADKKLVEKTQEHFWQVFSPKVQGLNNLLAATQADPIKAIVLFSSAAGRFGNMGQSDYAMANEILARVAMSEQMRRGGSCVVKSIAWGPWQSGMVTPMLRQLFEKFGVAVIPLQEGAMRFVREICQGPARETEVFVGGGEPGISPSSVVGKPPVRRFDIRVEADRYPYIDSHRIQGRAVVPTVLVAEWFSRAGRSLAPHLTPVAIEDLRINRGLAM